MKNPIFLILSLSLLKIISLDLMMSFFLVYFYYYLLFVMLSFFDYDSTGHQIFINRLINRDENKLSLLISIYLISIED